jgi:geranylgeranyl pyrophosphate synthase
MLHSEPLTKPVNGMIQTIDPADLLDDQVRAVDQLMMDAVDSDVSVLRDASRHIIDAGGKRIRPRLMLLTYLALHGEIDGLKRVIAPAAALELVHTASVVHDDINDHGVVRRGRPSVNAIWGRTFALLTGDFLFTKVYELMAPYKDLNIVLADATVALVEGETLQAQAVKENNFTREIYYTIIGRKTAALFSAAAEIGARMANAPQAVARQMADFGYNIGLAFQIVDDVLDIIGDSEQLGKTSGIDLAQGRGYLAVSADDTPSVDDADPMASIKRKVLQGDRLEEARQQSRALVESSIVKLNILSDSPYKDGLIELAHRVIERKF